MDFWLAMGLYELFRSLMHVFPLTIKGDSVRSSQVDEVRYSIDKMVIYVQITGSHC